jgi:1-deoxy-D-xylulose-5-phosphate reductoisomerase
MKKRVAVLGATGSIGKSTLDIIRNERDHFEPVLFTARENLPELLKLKKEFPGALVALLDSTKAFHKANDFARFAEIDYLGKEGILKAISEVKADITVNGISGAAGLEPSFAAIHAGSDLALANKETIVMAGNLILKLAEEKKVRIIPVDSEHSAIFKLLEAHGKDKVSELILTASGGPFKNYSLEELSRVAPNEALAHPTWSMGPKISVDSATLANKGLEVIEAAFLFGFSQDKIKVTVHPQSIVHSMVRLKNGAVYAQMSKPDMKLPIHEALNWPAAEYSPYSESSFLDFDSLSLSFEKPDLERFPMLALAYQALEEDYLPIAYNAANEAAVEAFLANKLSFLDISRVVSYVMNMQSGKPDSIRARKEPTIETVLALDQEARSLAAELIGSIQR